MSEPIHVDDGCSLSPREVLARLEIGLKSDDELHPDFPGNGPIVVEMSQEEADATARFLHDKFIAALPSKGEGISDLPEAPEQR